MAFSIRTNVSSLEAQRNLFNNQHMLDDALTRLSTGFRINKAADDAAGLAISDRIVSQVRGLDQAGRNAQDGISMVETAEGAMNEQGVILQRMRELAVGASNGTLSQSDLANINTELQAIYQENDRIASATKFNGVTLLTGSMMGQLSTSSSIYVGWNSTTGNSGSLAMLDVSKSAQKQTFSILTGSTSQTMRLSNGTSTQDVLITALSTGGGTTTMSFSSFGVSLTLSSMSVKTGANWLADWSGLTLTTQSGFSSVSMQVGANYGDTFSVGFVDTRIGASGSTNTNLSALNAQLAVFNSSSNQTQTNAQALLSCIDSAINVVTTNRAILGASQNRLDHALANVQNQSTHLSAANSRIRDVDIASESAALTRSQILVQAGVSVLAQANQAPLLALKLLV